MDMDKLEQLSETLEQSDFILVSSQNESNQQYEGDQMVNMVMNLPALQVPKTDAKGHPKRSLVKILHLESATDSSSDNKNSKTVETILDTDTDSRCEDEDQIEQPDCISESELDDKWNTTIVQQIPADDGSPESPVEPDHTPKDKVKIIPKANDELPDILEKINSNDSQSYSLSSFQSRSRSNLGSYDQCELYSTQQPHAKGYRFKLFPCSQDDMFAESEGGNVSTPSVHIGSLHLSQEAMLVPETVESYNESPSQDISSPPVIIPCSPTDNDEIISDSPKGTESQNDSFRSSQPQPTANIRENLTGQLCKDSNKVYDVTANETLAVGNQEEESEQDQSVTSTKSGSKSIEKESWNSQRFQEALLIPTVYDNDFNSEPLHLHLSASNTLRTQTHDTSIEVIGVESVRNPSQNSQNSIQQMEAFQKKASPRSLSFNCDVTVIGSGSTDHHQDDEFHLTIPNGTSEQALTEMGGTIETEIQRVKPLTKTVMVKADDRDIARPESIAEVAVANMRECDDATKKVTDPSEGNKLTLQMIIRLDNEPVSEPIFKLERPMVEEYSQLSDDASIDMFSKSARQRLRKRQYIADSDSDNDIDNVGKQVKESMECKKKCTDEKVEGSEEGKECKAESQANEKHGEQRVVQSGREEIFIAQKIVSPEVINPDEFSGTTESYTYCVPVSKMVSDTAMDIEYCNKTVTEETAAQSKNLENKDKMSINVCASANIDKGNALVNVTERFAETRQLIESSTQTLVEKVVVTMDVRDLQAVQKVEEYLQSGCHPRSRTSSTSTEHSDLHADMMEKCENNKTPHRMKTSLNKRDSDVKSPKSPKEIQDILKKYSDIILKTQQKQKAKAPNDISPGSQTSNHRESVVPGHLIPRRLSTQSLPEDLIQTKQLSSHSYVRLKEQFPEEFGIKDRMQLHVSQPSKQLEKQSQSVLSCNPAKTNDTVCVIDLCVDSKPQLSVSFNQEISEALSTNVTGMASGGREMSFSSKKETSFSSKKETSFTSSGTVNSGASVQHDNKNITDPKPSGNDNEHSLVPSDMVSLQPQNFASSAKDDSHVLDCVRESDEKQMHFLRQSLRKPKKKKQLKSLEVRNVHPQVTSGTFVSTTQGFVIQDSAGLKPQSGHDPYVFRGSQSQISSEEQPDLRMQPDVKGGPAVDKMSDSFGELTAVNKHQVIHKQHGRLLHKKSGLQKLQISTDKSRLVDADVQAPRHVSFDTSNTSEGSHVLAMGKTNTSFTVTGSNPSIPSSISQGSLGAEVVKSPSGCETLAVGQETSTRLMGVISAEQFSPDTLRRSDGDQDSIQMVTIVTKTVETLVKRIDTIEEVFGSNSQLLKNSKDVKMVDLYKLQENVKTEYKYMSMSPSRSVTSLTSGDLADISSSLSKSSGSTINFQSIGKDMRNQPDHQTPGTNELGNNSKPVTTVVISDQEAAGHINSPSTVLPQALPTSPSPSVTTNTKGAGNRSMHQTPGTTATGDKSKTATPVVQSDQDASDALTPLGSTINKSGSYLHSRTVSVESPKASESLFSSSSDDERKKRQTRSERTVKIDKQSVKLKDNVVVMERDKTGSSDEVSPMIPIQHHEVNLTKPAENEALVRSSGEIGSRVIAKWKDGFYYPGTLKSSVDYSKYFVCFDDGDSLLVKVNDILLIEQLPVGQSVMVLTKLDDFEYGLIIKQLPGCYLVETDAGHTGSYTYNQVILSADQAACIIADRGGSFRIQLPKSLEPPHHLSDVSLDNLIDEPRRSAKKKAATPPPVKDEAEQAGQGQTTGRSRKRKLDMLQPQATSTPTSPKEKLEPVPKQRRVETKSLQNSPVRGGLLSSPGRRSLSKAGGAGGDVVSKDIGPIPKKKIFRGIYFLMTHTDKCDVNQATDKKRSHDSSQGMLTDDSATEEVNLVPFNKDHLTLQIEAGDGTVVQDMDDQLLSSGKKLVLISSTHQRTLKYMQCLACGVPCLSHMWVVDSCTQGQLLNEKSYVLPAGISLERNRLMEWKKKGDIFLGLKAVVHSKIQKFVMCWSEVLQFGKCQVHKHLQFTDVDVIFTDDTCSPATVRQARSKSVPLLSTEWIIQSLINGKMVAYNGHPRYKIDVGIST